MPEHECIIGQLSKYDHYDLATVADIKEHIEERKELNRIIEREAVVYSRFKKFFEWTLKDYADGRKSTNLNRFNYCPECGKKIDWKKIRKEGDI